FNEKAFAQGSPDYDKLHSALHPMVFGVGGDPWMSLLSDEKFLMERLQVIEHRLTQGQSAMKSPQEDEILIQPGTPHSAYVKLRDIVESASRSLMLIDPYVDRTLFVLLANTQPGVNVRILTRKANLPGDFLLEAGKFKQQYAGSLEVRHGLTDLHDRFLLAD